MNIDKIDAFIFDFDGVLTDNFVHTDENGKELVVAVGRMDLLSMFCISYENRLTFFQQNRIQLLQQGQKN